jgi:hypothetical protein
MKGGQDHVPSGAIEEVGVRAVSAERAEEAGPTRLKVLVFLRSVNDEHVFKDLLGALLGRSHEAIVALEQKGKPPPATVRLFEELRERDGEFDHRRIRPQRGTWRILGSAVRRSLDYLWLLEPEHAGSTELRAEARAAAPRALLALLFLPPFRWPLGRRPLAWLLRRLEAGMPTPRGLRSFVKAEAPDVVVVAPPAELNPVQGSFIRTADVARVPSVLVVVGWDEVAAKRVWDVPTLAVVSNGDAVNEAVHLHGIPRERVEAVGGQSFNGVEAPSAAGAVEALEHASSTKVVPRREGRILRPILWLLTPLVAVLVALLRPRATVRTAVGLVRRAGRSIRRRARRLRRSLRLRRAHRARGAAAAAKEQRATVKRERAHKRERAKPRHRERAGRKTGEKRAGRAAGGRSPKPLRSGSKARERGMPRRSAARRTLRPLRRRWKDTRRGIRGVYNRRYRFTYRRTIARVPSRDELPALLNARGLHGRGAEIGVKVGRYSDRLLSNWDGDQLISIDPWLATDPDEYVDRSNVTQDEFDAFYEQARKRLNRHGERSEIWRMTSVEAAAKVPERSLDFVYIDARHDYESVREDLAAWCSKVRPGGILAGHDYVDGDLPEGRFYVKSAVDEFFGGRGIPVHGTEGPSAVESFPTWIVEVPEEGVTPTAVENADDARRKRDEPEKDDTPADKPGERTRV